MSERDSRENGRSATEPDGRAPWRRPWPGAAIWAGAAVVAIGAGVGIGLGVSGSSSGSPSYVPLSTLGTLAADPPQGALGPEDVPIPSVPVLAAPSAATAGQPIDGIGCDPTEQLKLHIHAHLTIFVNGQQRQVPAGIGIPGAVAQPAKGGSFIYSGKCFYFLHTHADDGIIHVESPVVKTYTLGEFFDEWQQPLSPTQVGPAKGKVTAIVDGEVYNGDPRDIPLGSHEDITLEVGTPLLAPENINWSITGL